MLIFLLQLLYPAFVFLYAGLKIFYLPLILFQTSAQGLAVLVFNHFTLFHFFILRLQAKIFLLQVTDSLL